MGSFCTNCGERLKEGAKFCENCGTACEDEITVVKNNIDARQTVLKSNHTDNRLQQRYSTQSPSKSNGGIWNFLAGTAIGTFIGSFWGGSNSSHSETINHNETIINDYRRNEEYEDNDTLLNESDDTIYFEEDDNILDDDGYEESYDNQYEDYDNDDYDDYDYE